MFRKALFFLCLALPCAPCAVVAAQGVDSVSGARLAPVQRLAAALQTELRGLCSAVDSLCAELATLRAQGGNPGVDGAAQPGAAPVPACEARCERLQGQVDSLQAAISGVHGELTQLRAQGEVLRTERTRLVRRSDSLEAICKRSQSRADTLLMLTAEVRFLRRYNKARIESKLNEIDTHLANQELRMRFPVVDLLREYERYNSEVLSVLESIASDGAVCRAFRNDEAVERAVGQLKATAYYSRYHEGEEWADWSIDYLNDRIDRAINRIRDKGRKLNLSDLISGLLPKS